MRGESSTFTLISLNHCAAVSALPSLFFLPQNHAGHSLPVPQSKRNKNSRSYKRTGQCRRRVIEKGARRTNIALIGLPSLILYLVSDLLLRLESCLILSFCYTKGNDAVIQGPPTGENDDITSLVVSSSLSSTSRFLPSLSPDSNIATFWMSITSLSLCYFLAVVGITHSKKILSKVVKQTCHLKKEKLLRVRQLVVKEEEIFTHFLSFL